MATTLLTCCTRQDDTKYRHWCSCPSATLLTKSVEKTATLCGFDEFEDANAIPAILPSSPPKRYKSRIRSFSSDSSGPTTYRLCATNSGTPEVSYSLISKPPETWGNSYGGTVSYTLNGANCIAPDLSFQNLTTYYNNTTWNCNGNLGEGNALGPSTDVPTGVNDWVTTSNTTKAYNYSVSRSYPAGSVEVGGANPQSFPYGSQTYNSLTNSGSMALVVGSEDTEDDALARATAIDGSSDLSLYETRDTGFSLIKRTVDYCALFTNLVKGKGYNGKIPKQSRIATIGSDNDWTDEDSDTFTISAAVGESRTHNKFHIEGGTLNESITPQEFIDESYSLDPTDYGLDASEDVITPDTELDHTQGYEYQIGQNDSGDPFYVEADA